MSDSAAEIHLDDLNHPDVQQLAMTDAEIIAALGCAMLDKAKAMGVGPTLRLR